MDKMFILFCHHFSFTPHDFLLPSVVKTINLRGIIKTQWEIEWIKTFVLFEGIKHGQKVAFNVFNSLGFRWSNEKKKFFLPVFDIINCVF